MNECAIKILQQSLLTSIAESGINTSDKNYCHTPPSSDDNEKIAGG